MLSVGSLALFQITEQAPPQAANLRGIPIWSFTKTLRFGKATVA